MSFSRKSSASSRPSSSSRASGSATVSSSGLTWRSAPDNYSYQKNQKFSLAAASTEFQPKSFQPAPGETILKPVFSKDPALTPTVPKKQIPTAPVVVVSSRTMKASPPIIRSTVEAIDAEQMLKKFDEDAAMMRAPKSKSKKSAPAAAAVEEPSTGPALMSASALRKQFAAAAADVEKLGATGLNKWDKKAWQNEQDKLLGIKPAPPAKAPFKMFLGLESKKEVRAKRKRDDDREQGLQVRSESSFTLAKKQKFAEREAVSEEAAGSWKMKIGQSHRGGVLQFNRAEIARVSGRGGARGGRGGRGGARGGRR